jgi:antitoxin component YwqK of YwqJK toxin-antitoxin module
MKKLLILLISIYIVSCSTTRINYDELVKEDDNIMYYQGKPFTGIVFDMWNKKQVKNEANFVNGKLEGKGTGYYESGVVNWKGNYLDGKLKGKVTSYYKSGNIYSEGNYVSDKLISEKCIDEDGIEINCLEDAY